MIAIKALTLKEPGLTMKFMSNFLNASAVIIVLVTVLSVWRYDAWWVRMWDFPRFQVVVLGVLLLLGRLVVVSQTAADKAILILLGTSLLLQCWRIFPYTSLASSQSLEALATDGKNDVSVMVSNVLMTNRQSDQLLDMIQKKRPDIFFAVETDDWWADELARLQPDYPHVVELPLDNTYGLVLYSRLELVEPEIRFLIEDDTPSIHTKARLLSGTDFHLHLLHPKPPYPTESLRTTERDAEILRVGREIGQHDLPTVVAGDLNDVAWSHTTRLFQRISGMLDPRIGRGRYSTFHAQLPWMRWPLDHVFHSHHFKLVSLERLPTIGSDHFPIFARLSYEPLAPLEQDSPEPETGDRREMIEKIDAAEITSDEAPDETLIPKEPDSDPGSR